MARTEQRALTPDLLFPGREPPAARATTSENPTQAPPAAGTFHRPPPAAGPARTAPLPASKTAAKTSILGQTPPPAPLPSAPRHGGGEGAALTAGLRPAGRRAPEQPPPAGLQRAGAARGSRPAGQRGRAALLPRRLAAPPPAPLHSPPGRRGAALSRGTRPPPTAPGRRWAGTAGARLACAEPGAPPVRPGPSGPP